MVTVSVIAIWRNIQTGRESHDFGVAMPSYLAGHTTVATRASVFDHA